MDILFEKHVKTRRLHLCHGCRDPIYKGTENIHYQNVVDDGRIYSNYTCNRCEKWVEDNGDYFDEGVYYEGDIREAMKDLGTWVESLPQAIVSTESAQAVGGVKS